MHIEAGIVNGAKLALGYASAVGVFAVLGNLIINEYKKQKNFVVKLLAYSIISTIMVFSFFEILPHYRGGISELHLIFGSSLFLIFGVIPSAIGLSLGLLLQGIFFAPFDLPQYGMNVTTLLVPLFTLYYLRNTLIGKNKKYSDIKYTTLLKLSSIYQIGVLSLVLFWVSYGSGFSINLLESIVTFLSSYIAVIVVEAVVDVGLLYFIKNSNFKTLSADFRLS